MEMAENRVRPATRPEHSERYWSIMKYLILGLVALMILLLLSTGVIFLRLAG